MNLRSLQKDLKLLLSSSKFGATKKIVRKFKVSNVNVPVIEKEGRGKRILKRLGKVALYTGGTIGGAYLLHQAGRYYGKNDKKWEKRWQDELSTPEQKILKKYGLDPDLKPENSNGAIKKIKMKFSRIYHTDKLAINKDYLAADPEQRKIMEDKAKSEIQQLNNDMDYLFEKGYSFGNTRVQKTKDFLKRAGRGAWNNKGKIIALSAGAGLAYASINSGVHRGRFDNYFDKQIYQKLKPELKQEWEYWKKNLDKLDLNHKIMMERFKTFLIKSNMVDDIFAYLELFYPEKAKILKDFLNKMY
jgi:hypothetical protein